MTSVNAIEIFSCSGGMAEGFRRAGITFAMVVDKDADACASYEANLGHRPIQMDVRDLVRMARAGWRPPGTLDLLVADPPCTPWSRAGKRLGVADERDMLVETCELIGLLRPRAYLIGNVPGLNDGPSWGAVQRYIGGLAEHGYCVADYAELDAAAYGVPQHRWRPFWFGHMEGACLRWPAPTHGPTAAPALPGLGLRPYVTCRDALAHLAPEELGRPVRLRWKNDLHPPSTPDQPAKVVPSSMPGNGGATLAFHKIDHRPSSPDEPAKTLTRNTHSDGALLSAPHPRHPISQLDEPSYTIKTNGGRATGNASTLALNPRHPPSSPDGPAFTIAARDRCQGATTLAWPWDRPSTVVCSGEVLAPFGRNGQAGESQRNHPNAVVLSEKAAAILQGFPEGWVFAGKTKRARWSQLGQAMPPGLAEPVARAIVEQMQGVRASGVAA